MWSPVVFLFNECMRCFDADLAKGNRSEAPCSKCEMTQSGNVDARVQKLHGFLVGYGVRAAKQLGHRVRACLFVIRQSDKLLERFNDASPGLHSVVMPSPPDQFRDGSIWGSEHPQSEEHVLPGRLKVLIDLGTFNVSQVC